MGPLGIVPFLPAVQCLHWFHIYVVRIYLCTFFSLPRFLLCIYSWRDSFACSVGATCRRRSQGISHATCHAFSHFSFSCCSGVIFRLPPPSIFHISGSDSHSSKWDLKCLNRHCSVFVISFVSGSDCRSFPPLPSGYRMRSGSPLSFFHLERLIRSSFRCHRVPDVASRPSAPLTESGEFVTGGCWREKCVHSLHEMFIALIRQ